jgi:hypothetical protein
MKDSGKEQMAWEGPMRVHILFQKAYTCVLVTHTVVDKNNCMVKNNR